jgi:para-nitrobenzyl esterase
MQMADAVAAPIVETAAGKVRGAMSGGMSAFKGVPYGAPTDGANRFMPPRPPRQWAGVRDATSYHAQAPQMPGRPERRPELRTILGPPDASPESEDCLTLNLWTPGVGDGGKRPVMVWLHGGAFAYGSGNRAVTDGANLARRGDVVVVSVNHRLNIFGFLHLTEIGGARYAHSGNAGMLDVVAALAWVRDHIEAFGGDPDNITIFGESGGGGNGSVLLAMPEARGLFHRAVIQSGAAIRVRDRERAAALTEAVMTELGIARGNVARLHEVSAERLAAAIAPASRTVGRPPLPLLDRYDFGPVVDGTDLPAQPFDPAAPEITRDIPLLIGGTREESGFFLADDAEVWDRRLNEDSLRQRVAAVAGAQADRVIDLYRTLRPGASREDVLIAALTGSNFWVRTVMLAERKAAQKGAPVWMYSLDWRSPACDGRLQAHHAMDLPFVFDNINVPDTTRGAPGARELAATVSATWAAFARSGSPENPALPRWPAYTPEERAMMVFDRKCRAVTDPDRDARALWEPIARRG